MLHPLQAAIQSRLLSGIFIIALLFSPTSISCQDKVTSPPEPIVVAYSPFEATSLFWIAWDQQFFAGNGLDISLRKYDTGAGSLSGMLNGESDITVGLSEFPVVRMAFQKERMAILGNANKGEFIFLVGRKDSGIEIPSDLKGKRVGVTKGTISEFFLGRFLELNGLKIHTRVLFHPVRR